MVFTETLYIEPLAPFSLELSAQIFLGLNRYVRSFSNGVFSQVLRANGDLVLAEITSKGPVNEPKLKIELTSNQPMTTQTSQRTKNTIEYIFNLTFDLNSFYKQTQSDPIMHKISQQLIGFKYPTTLTAFESLVDSIVEQQISIKIARIIEERLAEKFGEKLEINGIQYYVFPTPQDLSETSISDIRSCGLSQRKAEYIYGSAKMVTEGKLNLELMQTNPDLSTVISELDKIKGIGVWTAELTIFRGMQRLDVLPADDFGIRRVISHYYCGDKPIKASEAREIAKAWGEYRGLAAFYLLAAEANDVVV